ncbi:hypothetical protein MSAN_02371200 [Mycena sanguinolenta]|uniref:Uncharacterized protein n=1 Tax=Mycena sanguinolenta TaxID=230812 RepID=A0A8H6X665_9AGAR|nr:hypothetical protein MSAN_02371200 [Mycena sanguinolenta]
MPESGTPPHNKPLKQLAVQPSTKRKAMTLPVTPVLPTQSGSPTPRNGKDKQALTPLTAVPVERQLKNRFSRQAFVQPRADGEATSGPVLPVPPIQTRSSTPQNRKDRQAVEPNARNMTPHNKPSKQVFVQPNTNKKATALPVPSVLPSQSRSPTPQNGKDRQAVEPSAEKTSTCHQLTVHMHGGNGGAGGSGGIEGGSGGPGEGPQLILNGTNNVLVNNNYATSKFF